MASAHVYVRVQVESSDERVVSIAQAVSALRDAVESAGGEWCGSAQVALDPPQEPAPAVETAEPTSSPAHGKPAKKQAK